MATTGRIVYHGDDETIKKDRREFSLTDEIMELINSGGGGGGGAINGVKVNGQIVNPDQAGYVGLTIPSVINNLNSTSTTNALSAAQGKVLYEYIQALQHVGHFLALWNTATGLPVTNPETSPYTYNTGDYYIVSNVAAEGGTNYKPNGSSYTINVASTTVESGEVQVNDLYFYDGYERRLLDNSGGGGSIAVDSSLSTTSTNPVQNAVITNRLNQMALDANTKTFWLTNLQDTTTGQAVRDWVDGGGNAIVYYSGMPYFITAKSATRITLYSKFTGTQNSPSNQSTGFTEQLMWIDNNNNTIAISNTTVGLGAPYLATNQNYSTVYTPLYDGSPATKKYVDDKFTAVPVYTAGSNIDITANQISTIRNGYVYVTCNDAASTKAKTGTSAEGNYTPQEGDLIMIHFVNGCSVGGPTIAIDGGTAIPFYIGVDSANAGNMYFGSNNVSKMFIYTDGKLVGDAVKDNNNVYSAGAGLALNNGVFSVDTTTIATQSDINVKAFFLEDDEDTTTAQAAIDWANEGKLPLLVFGDETYTLVNVEDVGLRAINDFKWIFSCDKDYLHYGISGPGYFEKSYISISTSRINDVDTVTSIEVYSEDTASVLTTGNSYQRFTPSLDYDPATKKYVDDTVGGAISSGTTAPSNPTEGQLWYDTTNDVLKVYDGTNWTSVSGGGADVVEVTVSSTSGATAKVGTTTAGNYTPSAGDFLLVTFTNGYYAGNATLNIDNSGAKYVKIGSTNVTADRFELSAGGVVMMYYDGAAYQVWTTKNTTYGNMTTAQAEAGTATTGMTVSPAVLKDAVQTWATAAGSTAPSSPTEGQLWYDTTNDVLKVYDGTTWNEVGGSGGVNITDVTVSTAYNTAAKVGTTTGGSYTPAAGDLLLVNFVNGFSTSSAPTLAIDSGTAYNIRVGNTAATSTYFSLGSTSSSNVKVLMYFDGTYYKVWSTQNTTYSGMSQSTASTGTSTTSSLISAKVLNDTIVEKAITLDPNSPLDVTTIWAGTETQYQALSTKGATTAYLCVEE